jgi:Fe2+ or Zn2+ uptake regulation protein
MDNGNRGERMRAMSLLQGAGLRLTPQRMEIAREVLSLNHPTAAEVYEAVRRRFPTMGLATVYATLNVMVERGLLRALAFEDAARYDANLAAHANLVCTACGQIDDLPGCDDILQLLGDRTAAAAGFLLEDQRVDLYGRCARCKADGAASTAAQPAH